MNKPKLEIKTLKELINEYEHEHSYNESNAEKLLDNKYIHKINVLRRIEYLTNLILSHKPAESKSEYLRFIKDSFKEISEK